MPNPYPPSPDSCGQAARVAAELDTICAPLELFSPHDGVEEHVVVAGALRTMVNYCGEPLSAVSAGQPALLASYSDCLAKINLRNHLTLVPGREVPRNLADFSLVAVSGEAEGWAPEGVYGMTVQVPPGLSCDFSYLGPSERGSFFADTPTNICLVYRKKVIAVAGAVAQDDATVRIVQLQGLTSKTLCRKDRMKSGLHSGFKWRETLLNAWCSVAKQAGFAAIEIQGSKNNRWNDPSRDESVRAAMRQGYDEVALGLDMVPTLEGNWRKDLKMSDKI